ncbi:hypothetical protein EN818_31080, partial [Mesorhizobium sp. M3A.F.Ca.ET.175.01.1.1]|uniref:FGGY family carbohydrate kinase n=1 Tax=Mesorhizobium sp. M3A.F.Ca.ET.175.01.1.1 TaxID=2563945 RepID=UPI0011391088
AIFAKVARVLLPKDYLRLWLTGEHISEMSDSAGTSWLDVGKRQWSSELLAGTSLDEKQMPSLTEGTAKAGALRGELASKWGIAAGIPNFFDLKVNPDGTYTFTLIESRPVADQTFNFAGVAG